MWNLKTRLTLISSFDCKYILVSGAAQHLIIIHSRRLRTLLVDVGRDRITG